MASRNSKLGTTDFTEEGLKPSELNDTFDSVIDLSVIGHGQLPYEIIRNTGSFDNKNYFFSDIYTDSSGANNTTFSSGTTASYNATDDSYDSTGSSTVFVRINAPFLNGSETFLQLYASENDDIYTGSGDGSDITPAHGETLGDTTARTTSEGFSIISKAEVVLKTITKNASCTATHAYIYDDNYNLIEKAAFSGNAATITTNVVLRPGKRYILEADSEGASYTRASNSTVTLPITNNNIIFNQSTIDGALTGTPFGFIFNIDSITTQALTGSSTQQTSIDYDVSDGTTTISNASLNEAVDISSLSTGFLQITFNVTGTATFTKKLYGFGGRLV